MADPNLGQTVASAWEAIVKKDPEDQIFEDYWLLDRLQSGGGIKTIDGGRLIEVPLEYATNTTVGSMSDLDPISTTRVDITDVAQFNWKEYAGTVVQSELENAINQGGGAKFDLLGAKLANLKRSMEKELNEDLYGAGTDNGGKVILGLSALVSSTPSMGTVGGINRATYSWFRNIQVAGTQSAAAYDNLRASMRSAYNQASNGVGADHPTFAVTTRTVFEGFEGLLLANERMTSKDSGEGAFKNEVLQFKGAKIAYDNDCNSATLYFLNPKYIKLVVAKGHWMKMYPPVDPANQLANVYKTHTQCGFIVTQPRRLAAVTAIS